MTYQTKALHFAAKALKTCSFYEYGSDIGYTYLTLLYLCSCLGVVLVGDIFYLAHQKKITRNKGKNFIIPTFKVLRVA